MRTILCAALIMCARADCSLQAGQNTHGVNLKMFNTGSAEDCCNACGNAKSSGCIGFTWVKSNRECWLKKGFGQVTPDNDVISGSAPDGPTPFPSGCGIDNTTDPQYNPSKQIDFAVINLDLPAKDRWTAVAKPFAAKLQDLVKTFKQVLGQLSAKLFAVLEALGKSEVENLLNAMPGDYGDEIRSIADASGLTHLDAFICNLIYEISGACTVVIAQDKDGSIYHGHNLDTAANWNFTTAQWVIADKLRAITMNLHYQKGGKTLFNTTSYVGYAGVFEGMRSGAFSVSINTRFDLSLYAALIDWITGKDRNGTFASFLVRDALTNNASFADAVNVLNRTKILGPGYIAVAGTQAGEGTIMSRSAWQSIRPWNLADELAKGKNYMVQTNWDHWLPDPFFDRRRVPCDKCMDGLDLKESSLDFEHLYKVMSAKPTRNKMTCHTSLFSANEGKIESYQQYCKEKGCRPFMDRTLFV